MKVWPYNLFEFLGVNMKSTDREDMMHAIVCAMSDLPEQEWKVTLLRFTCGYDNDLIAKRVGVTSRTVKNILMRVKDMLTSEPASLFMCFGYTAGMKLVKNLFNGRSANYLSVPIEVAFPEQPLQSYLLKANFECVADIEELGESELLSIRGIGRKYLEIVNERKEDFVRMDNANKAYKDECESEAYTVTPIPITVINGDGSAIKTMLPVTCYNTDTVAGCEQYLASADTPEKVGHAMALLSLAKSKEPKDYAALMEANKDDPKALARLMINQWCENHGVTV